MAGSQTLREHSLLAMAEEILEITPSVEEEFCMEELSFKQEIEKLINRHSKENGSNTPDWILAEYLSSCLISFDFAVNQRERFFGREVGGNPFTAKAPTTEENGE